VLIYHPVSIKPEEQKSANPEELKSEDHVNTYPVLINPQEQKSEDRVNTPPCLNHSEEQKSADLINPEEHRNELG
jgi:hypothetical protein